MPAWVLCSATIGVLKDIIDIDGKLAEEILFSNVGLIDSSEVADSMVKELKTEAGKEIVYKLFVDRKIKNLNNVLVRRDYHAKPNKPHYRKEVGCY